MSLGGFGTWDIASRYPDYFAAIMPLVVVADKNGRDIKDIQPWVFHR